MFPNIKQISDNTVNRFPHYGPHARETINDQEDDGMCE